jgi:hypothetical protein
MRRREMGMCDGSLPQIIIVLANHGSITGEAHAQKRDNRLVCAHAQKRDHICAYTALYKVGYTDSGNWFGDFRFLV